LSIGDHGWQSFLVSTAGFEEAGQVATFPELGDEEKKRAGAGIKTAVPVAVAVAQALGSAVRSGGAGLALYLDFHYLPKN